MEWTRKREKRKKRRRSSIMGQAGTEAEVTRERERENRAKYRFWWYRSDNAPSSSMVAASRGTDEARRGQGPRLAVLRHQISIKRDRKSASASHPRRLTLNSTCMTLVLHHAPKIGKETVEEKREFFFSFVSRG